MVVTLKPNATDENIKELIDELRKQGLDGRVIRGSGSSTINIIGDETRKMNFLRSLENLPYVSSFKPISNIYKSISREAHPDYNGEVVNGGWLSKEIRAGPLVVGGHNKLALIAGPCSVDADDPNIMDETAAMVKENGATGFRGGAYKPRTLPYDFRGHGIRALEMGRTLCDKYNLAFVTEPVRLEHIAHVVRYADVLQIGTRNATQPFYLDVAEATLESQTPILAKRGMSQYLLKEFLPLVVNIYDYSENRGNHNIMLCLRGIRTFDDSTRFTLDAGSVPVLKYENILPVIGDPSHPAGLGRYVISHAKALIASGVDGLLVEVYPEHGKAKSDAAQAISHKGLEEIVSFAKLIGRM